MRKVLVMATVMLVLLFSQGCASIFLGTTQRVRIDSEPSGAYVRIDGADIGTTPVDANLSRGSSHNIAVEKDGLRGTARIDKSFGATTLLNLLFFWPSIIVDFATGAAYYLEPDQVDIRLREESKR